MPTNGQDVKIAHYTRSKFNSLTSKDNATIYYVEEPDGKLKQYIGNTHVVSANDDDVVKVSGAQTISGIKTFNDGVIIPGSNKYIDLGNKNNWFWTRFSGENWSFNNNYTGGGWARNLMEMKDAEGNAYLRIGAQGNSQNFSQMYIGPAYNNYWLSLNNDRALFGTKPQYANNPTANNDLTRKKYVDDGLDTKVDKVSGKGLSTNDYTTTEKNKLSGIQSGAEVNVATNLSQGARNTTTLRIDSSTGSNLTLPAVTTSLAGLMSATDKTRLDVLHSLLEEDTSNSVVDSITEVLEIFNNYPEGADLVTALAGKVDKVTGKGLSTNDFTTTEKNKLGGIAVGAQVNSAITKAEIEAKLTGLITSHTHTINDVSGLQASLDGKAPTSHTHGFADVIGLSLALSEFAPLAHTHTIANVTGLQSALDGKASSSHNHSGTYEPVFTKNTAFNKNFGTTAGTVTQGNDSRLTNARTPLAHTHTIANVTGLQSALDGKASSSHTHAFDEITGLALALSGFAQTSHTHNAASTSAPGFMSASDKSKLNGIAVGAEVNVATNLSQGARNTTTLRIDSSTGSNLTLPAVTTSLAGLMSATDKTRLDVLHSLLEEDTSNSVVDSITEVLEIFNNYPEGADLVTALAGKVDKVTGKGLSTNDFTTTEKNKLGGIAVGAQVNRTIATTTQAQTGTNNTTAMTPLRVKEAITANARSNTWTPTWSQVSDKPTWIGSSKPSYTASEVGAAPASHTHSQYLTSFTETDPTVPAHVKSITSGNISSWNNKFNAPAGTTSQYLRGDGSLASFPTIPSAYQLTKSKIETALVGPSAGSIQLGSNTTMTGVIVDDSITIGTNATVGGQYVGSSIAIGHNAGVVGQFASNATAIGANASAAGASSTALGYDAYTGNSQNTMRLGGNLLSTLQSQVNLSVTSDIRDKADIEEVPTALDFIKDLNPITYVRNDRDNYISEEQKETETYKDYLMVEDYDRKSHSQGTKKGGRRRVGLSAQEVRDKLIEHYGSGNYANVVNDNFVEFEERDLDIPEGLENKLTMSYETMVPFLIKAIQEQQEQIEELKQKINSDLS